MEIVMKSKVNSHYMLTQVAEELNSATTNTSRITLDFTDTEFIDPTTLPLIITISAWAIQQIKENNYKDNVSLSTLVENGACIILRFEYQSPVYEYLCTLGLEQIIQRLKVPYIQIEFQGISTRKVPYKSKNFSGSYILDRGTSKNMIESVIRNSNPVMYNLGRLSRKDLHESSHGEDGYLTKRSNGFAEICYNSCTHSGTGSIVNFEYNSRSKEIFYSASDYGCGIIAKYSADTHEKASNFSSIIPRAIFHRFGTSQYGIYGVLLDTMNAKGEALICTDGRIIQFHKNNWEQSGLQENDKNKGIKKLSEFISKESNCKPIFRTCFKSVHFEVKIPMGENEWVNYESY